jgi:hypothetical protein
MAGAATQRSRTSSARIAVRIGPYRLEAATAFGPRLTGLRRDEGPELFAQLSGDVGIDLSESRIFRFYGGHRLWAAPEIPSITYAPDDHPCDVSAGSDELTVTAPADASGFVKQLSVRLDGNGLVVDHRLTNAASESASVAAWAITQFQLGGLALLPIGPSIAGDEFQADRSLVLWSYTDLTDPRLSWQERAVVVEAAVGPRFKIGSGPSPGRLGYLIDRQLFTKEITSAGAGTYPDRGAVGQVFVEDSFCELESVGPIVALEPGSSITHREFWEVTDCADLATAYDRLVDEGSR